MLRLIPLFAVLLAVYNLLLLSGDINATLGNTLFEMGLISGAQWRMTTSDLLLMFGVVTLYIEIFKSTRTGMASVASAWA